MLTSTPLLRLARLTFGLSALLIACSGRPSTAPEPTSPTVVDESRAERATATPQPTATPDTRWQGTPELATESAVLAEQLTAAERAIADLNVTGAELAWYGHLHQRIHRALVARPELRHIVQMLPPDVSARARMILEAGVSLRSLVSPGRDLPSWRIVEPAPMDELLDHYQAAEAEFGVPWQYLAAVHLTETVMGRIRGT